MLRTVQIYNAPVLVNFFHAKLQTTVELDPTLYKNVPVPLVIQTWQSCRIPVVRIQTLKNQIGDLKTPNMDPVFSELTPATSLSFRQGSINFPKIIPPHPLQTSYFPPISRHHAGSKIQLRTVIPKSPTLM
jgi:hypothetical protein